MSDLEREPEAHYDVMEVQGESLKYAAVIPLYVAEKDSAVDLRRMLKIVGQQVGILVMRTWLANPGNYNVDIRISMERKK